MTLQFSNERAQVVCFLVQITKIGTHSIAIQLGTDLVPRLALQLSENLISNGENSFHPSTYFTSWRTEPE